ncbi:MAG: O-antigen ligase family protein [Desulfobacteraceae bacterium]|nr:O-antigen ligase family protein [Desulfobacteraceae bacterium]
MATTRAEGKPLPFAPADLFFLLLSVLAGILFLVIVQLPVKFFLAGFGGLLLLAVTAAVPDKKKLFLALMILALPFGVSKTFGFTFSSVFRSTFGYTVYASFLPLVPLYFIAFYRRIFNDESILMPSRGMLPLTGLLIITALSCFAAHSRWALFDLFEMACSFLLYAYMSSQIKSVTELRLVAFLLMGLATFEGVVATGQYLTGSNLGFGFVLSGSTFLVGWVGGSAISRVMGTVGHPITLAMYFDFLIPITFAYLVFYPMEGWKRALGWCAFFIQYFALAVTFSRGGFIFPTLMMATMYFIYLRRRMEVFRSAVIFLFVGSILFTMIFVIPNPIQKGMARTEGAASAAGRITLAKVALNVIAAHPVLGLGPNMYTEKVSRYDDTPEQTNREWNAPVHNLYLLIAGEIGLIGLFCFLWVIWASLRPLANVLSADNPVIACTGLGVLMGTLAFLGHCIADMTLWTHPRIHWFIFGLAVSIGRLAKQYMPKPVWKGHGRLYPWNSHGREAEAEA